MAKKNSEKIDQELKDTKDIVSKILERKKNAEADMGSFFDNADESFRFYKSDQYDTKTVNALKSKGLPYLVINICKEIVNTMVGFQRQNPIEPGVIPIEGTDDRLAEVMGRVVKWSMAQKLNRHSISTSFKNKVIGGLGVNFVYPDFSDDPVNGELRIKSISPFDVKFDPLLNEIDLSDCRFIIYEGRIEKADLKKRFSEYATEIGELEPGERRSNYKSEPQTTNKKDRGLLVTEHWYRESYDQECYFDEETGDIVTFNGDDVEKSVIEESRNVEFFTRTRSRIRLQILIEDKILAYDGENPYGIDYYPFVFDFGYFEPAIDDWNIKLCGEIDRSIKDVNKEKNKRRSQMAAVVAKMPHTGYFVEENSVSDENKLERSGGISKIIHYRRGFTPPKEIMPLQLPPALIQLEQMTNEDKYTAGMKPEMLGQMGEKGAPLGLHQMRQSQALMSVQETIDNHSACVKQIGKIMIELILKHFSNDKIKRIVGSDLVFVERKLEFKKKIKELERFVPKDENEVMQFNQVVQNLKIEMTQLEEEETEFWETWESLDENSRFDIEVDESANSTTYRIATQQMLMAFNQNSGMVPADMLIEVSDLPRSIKDRLIASYQQQQQAQQQALQEERQMKLQGEAQRNEIEKLKAVAGMGGNPELAKLLMQ